MEVSSSQLLFGFLLLVLLTCGLIFGGRLLLKYRSTYLSAGFKYRVVKEVNSNRTKYPSVDGSRFSRLFLFFGLAVAVAFSLLIISWTEYEKPVYATDDTGWEEDLIEVIPQTVFSPPRKPSPLIETVDVPTEDFLFIEEPILPVVVVGDNLKVAEIPVVRNPTELVVSPPAQIRQIDDDAGVIVSLAEQMPRFPGCEDISGTNDEKYQCAVEKLLEYIYERIKYPSFARENRIEGRVVVHFVVERDGQITNASITHDIGAGCGEEVLIAVNSMNSMDARWTPGKQRGRPVRVRFTLPVSFKLN